MMSCWREHEAKRIHDPLFYRDERCTATTKVVAGGERRRVWVPGAVIVGAGPSGLAVAACLKERGVPSVVLERSDCIASLWRLNTYDRLRLHLPKQFCELPLMPFPAGFPTYPTKHHFLAYLRAYARHFRVRPIFQQAVESADYDGNLRAWRVRTAAAASGGTAAEYVCRWLVVATGENAEAVVPEIDGMGREFKGPVVYTSSYRSGDAFRGKRVLVVGCGNSGMEVCLDLCNHNAYPSIVVRDTVHVLPRDMLGRSTFGLSMWLLKWLPIRTVDRLLLLFSRLMLGDTTRLGLDRPRLGPLELKSLSGKTPVLDVGTLAKIKSGHIKVCPAIKRLTEHGAEFVDGRSESFDAVVLATGYRSNVPSWLKRFWFCRRGSSSRRKTACRGVPFPTDGKEIAGFTPWDSRDEVCWGLPWMRGGLLTTSSNLGEQRRKPSLARQHCCDNHGNTRASIISLTS